MRNLSSDQLRLQEFLLNRGPATSLEIQLYLGKSQSSISRLLAGMPESIARLGQARSTRYSIQKSIHGLPFQHALFRTDISGRATPIGHLKFLANDTVHVETPWFETTTQGLPWYLAPWRMAGFLGRIHARRLQPQGLDANPDRWTTEDVLYSALQLSDHPGALELGDQSRIEPLPTLRQGDMLDKLLDRLATGVASTLPAGSSAEGEQPKFLANFENRDQSLLQAVLVKFSPPLDTPFGQRWHDLLLAEALAGSVLNEHGIPAAIGYFHTTRSRAYLLSPRFDRIGMRGRRHVVSIGAAHQGLVTGRYTHWADTAQSLQALKRLSRIDAERVRFVLYFGRLIGNTDMHEGNLSLFIEPEQLPQGTFALAPVYDMLPMIWRPNAHQALGETPFTPDARALGSSAAPAAREFWVQLADSVDVAPSMRAAARTMAGRCGPDG